ncbi:hypothetical protein [Sphingobium lactosutens]|jgi:hypothetical protein|uniref:Uncharacterized protein n=1 Tax=Sphingobium lactosutens DS20 TaxID=1331060 RepID=T0HHZ4_9SPHN|nr:hypothetical protein [Sphingobium lactosutens]EQB15936.1 hypothetical protein RLDS_09470 [Sphingobium lactosutens DS20]
MNWFPLLDACKRAECAFGSRFEELKQAILTTYRTYDAHANDRLDSECALFILWSIEIGLLNAPTWWFDRHRAERRFANLLRRGLREQGVEFAGRKMEEVYRARFRDALRTIRNIHVEWDTIGYLQPPLTVRTTKLFISYTTDISYPLSSEARADMHHRLHAVLTDGCRACVLSILPPAE